LEEYKKIVLHKSFLFDFGIIFLVILAGFFPALLYRYAFHNDLSIWLQGNPGHDVFRHIETGHLVLIGRPVQAVLLWIQTTFIRYFLTIHTLVLARGFAILSVALTAALLNLILIKGTQLSRCQRLTFMSLATIQPGFFIGVFWMMNFTPLVVGFGIGLLSGIIYALRPVKKHSVLISAVLVAIAFLNYPPSACAFFIPMILLTAFTNKTPTILDLAKAISLFGLSSIFGYLNHLIWIKSLLCKGGFAHCWTWTSLESGDYGMTLATHLGPKILLLGQAIKMVGVPWNTFAFGTNWMALTAAIGLIFLALWNVSASVQSPLKRIFISAMYGLGVTLVLCSANLVATGQVIGFRTLIPLGVFIAIGWVKLINLIPARKIRNLISVIAVAILTSSSAMVGLEYIPYYEESLSTLESTPEMPELCKNRYPGVDLWPFERAFRDHAAGGSPTMYPLKNSETHSFEFGIAAIPPLSISGICMLLKEPGSRYEHSATY